MRPLGDLDRRIAAALLRDGRASWRRIAAVLGETERRIARHGAALLERGAVRIHAQGDPRNLPDGEATFLRVRGAPSALAAVGERMADHSRSTWVSGLAGPAEVVGEYFHSRGELAGILDDCAQVRGVTDIDARPQLQFHRTVSGWAPPILDADQLQALRESEDSLLAGWDDYRSPDETTRALIGLLARNGRATVEELASGLGLSKSTASRRLDAALARGQVRIRAVVDPALLGYPVETVVTVQAVPAALEQVGVAVAARAEARWVSSDGGLLYAQLANRDRTELHESLRAIAAHDGVRQVVASPVLRIFKRSTVRYRDGAPEPV
ncbi:Lrp/AsnC family transcriptional regulator [Microbacterium luticocti]|uniref:Lrp/AsnC family transcriptional regulator n=1 Tax=Microbacterium luticocti TaxID=451764 RepID=UPI000402AF9E|nr:AsnC family transcriptional regulator [Microbacterium luticocti]